MSRYQDYEDWKRWEKNTFGRRSDVDDAYFASELGRAGISACEGLRIYEIGFGNGAFASYVCSKGGEYFGSEINEALLERAREFGLNVFEGGIEQALATGKSESFDAVVAFDVLEHLDVAEIKSFLLDSSELLRQGGVVLARVPSGDSPFGRAILHGDITHRTALGSSAIWQLASQTGFEVAHIGSPQLPILGLGLVRGIRRGCVQFVQRTIALFINLVFHDGQPRVITPNLVFVLKKPIND